ncbi:hypothetical protein BC829DRAFT_85627 [Chytridium lagenaria]|nr:hypothetical protein BC829DRAFT_85627 [Chytridium lagenaria]
MDLKRPSIFINEVQSFIAAHTRIEVISDILIVPDLQAVLIEQSDLASVKSSLNVLIESSLIQSKKPPRKPHQATQISHLSHGTYTV